MSKYYQPTLDEFHIGFEYEMELLPGEWTKAIITEENYTMNLERPICIPDTCRVKYLDREDIESEGWMFVYTAPPFTSVFAHEQGCTFAMRDNGQCTIVTYDGVILNKFLIKNKSEFKKIIQQIVPLPK